MPCQYHIDIFWHLINNIVLRQSPWLLACIAVVLCYESCLASVCKNHHNSIQNSHRDWKNCLLNFAFCCLNKRKTWNSVGSVHNLAWSSLWRVTHYTRSDVKRVYLFLCLSLPRHLLLLIQDNARLFQICTRCRLPWSSSEQVFYFTGFAGLLSTTRMISRLRGADFTCTLMEANVTRLNFLFEQMKESKHVS